MLEDHRRLGAPATQRHAAQRRHVDAVGVDAPGRGLDEPVHQAQQGRLAGAGRADHHHELARLDGEIDAVDRG